MNSENTIDISALTPDQKKQMRLELQKEEKAEKAKKQVDIATLKELSSNFLNENIGGLIKRQGEQEDLVAEIFKNFDDIIQLKAQVYGVDKLAQDSHTITNADGDTSITIGYNVGITFDGSETAGVQKIMDYLTGISGDEENEDMKKMAETVKLLLKPSMKTKMLNPSKIIQLNQMRSTYNSPEFDEGMDIIVNAQIRQVGSSYVSGYKFIQIGDNQKKKVEFRFTV
ncbi:DUF3164 family protein [Flavobacterium sp.]